MWYAQNCKYNLCYTYIKMGIRNMYDMNIVPDASQPRHSPWANSQCWCNVIIMFYDFSNRWRWQHCPNYLYAQCKFQYQYFKHKTTDIWVEQLANSWFVLFHSSQSGQLFLTLLIYIGINSTNENTVLQQSTNQRVSIKQSKHLIIRRHNRP